MQIDDQRIKHLEFIQAIIARLAGNSFLMKGWTVTLVAALFALAAKDANRNFMVVAFLPAICFWGLDAYYLRQERIFRALYTSCIRQDCEIPIFSMDTSKVESSVANWAQTLFDCVVVFYHAPVVASIAAAMCFL
jgi:hypothetical protein